MKRALQLAVAIVIAIATLFVVTSCVRPEYTVTFVLGDDRDDVVATVQSGSELFTPDADRKSVV